MAGIEDLEKNNAQAEGAAPAPNAPRPASSARLWRPVVGVVAAVVLAFCGWSAWQYANGNDPLAFLAGDAFQTVAEPKDDAAATPQITAVSNTVTADDVCAAAAGLTFDGADVSVASDEVVAVISDGGIWVEQATTDDAATMVSATVRRAAALAAWAADQNVGFTQATWIAEDANGAVRMVVRFVCSVTVTSGSEQALLSTATGYAISGNAYAQLGDAPGFAQSSGEAPTLPDAAEVTVVANKTAEGEALEKTKTTNRVVDQNGKEVSSKSSSSDDDSSAGSGSGSTSSARQGDTITVYITVDGSSAGAGSSSATLSLPAGATVYDALAGCGVSFNASVTGYGMYVSSIGGLAEKDHGGMSGWMYSVDGVTPNVACSSYTLSGGESIYWWYANVEY
ncbi:MAG: DUF4430 domain-containing protein [Coriobacteriia bacterium]|nr:DUF4430 domain-containing protein [Coriobacteriia bacterium]